MSKFISINYCVPLDDILGWEPVKGKMVPKALWAITKRVGKGCRAQSDKKKYGLLSITLLPKTNCVIITTRD